MMHSRKGKTHALIGLRYAQTGLLLSCFRTTFVQQPTNIFFHDLAQVMKKIEYKRKTQDIHSYMSANRSSGLSNLIIIVPVRNLYVWFVVEGEEVSFG